MISTEVKKLTLGYKQNTWLHDFTATDSVLLNTLYDTLIPVAPYCFSQI